MLFMLEDSHSAGIVSYMGVFSSLRKAVESAREAYKNGYDGYNSGYWQSPVPQRKIEHLQVFLVSDVDIGETARELAYCLDCDGSETFVGISYATSASEDLVNSAKELDAEFVCGRIID